jgi:integrase
LHRLFAAARKERGTIEGIPAGYWWEGFLAFVFCTAERKGAALALRWEWIDLARLTATIPPQVRKGRTKAGQYRLWPEIVPLLVRIQEPQRELVFPWPKCERAYYTVYDRILRDAGLPVNRNAKTHCLRASHATWQAAVGADAAGALLHSDPATTRKHYIDVRHLPPVENKLFVPWTGEQVEFRLPSSELPAELDQSLAWI